MAMERTTFFTTALWDGPDAPQPTRPWVMRGVKPKLTAQDKTAASERSESFMKIKW